VLSVPLYNNQRYDGHVGCQLCDTIRHRCGHRLLAVRGMQQFVHCVSLMLSHGLALLECCKLGSCAVLKREEQIIIKHTVKASFGRIRRLC
jgi:hypothetical protein